MYAWADTFDAGAQSSGLASSSVQSAAVNVATYSWSGYFMGLALMFLMLAMLWYGTRWIKRSGSLRFLGMTPGLNIESRLSLGPRKHLLVLRYRNKRLLLGVTEQSINLLFTEELSTGELPTGELNTARLNADELNTARLNAGELNTARLNKDKLELGEGESPVAESAEALGGGVAGAAQTGIASKFKDILHDLIKHK